MPAPTPVAENFISCINSSFKLAGTEYTGIVTDGGFDHEVGSDDMTTGGFMADVPTNAGATFTVTVGWPLSGGAMSGTPLAVTGAPYINEGSIYATVMENPNGPYISGNFRYKKSGNPIFGKKNAVKITYTGASVGTFTRINPTPGT